MNGDILLTFNRVVTNRNKKIILKNGSFMELMNAVEKAGSPVGFAKCKFPHFFVQDLGSKLKQNIWVLNGVLVVGDDAALQAAIDANP